MVVTFGTAVVEEPRVVGKWVVGRLLLVSIPGPSVRAFTRNFSDITPVQKVE